MPSDWQGENLEAAKVVVDLLHQAVSKGRRLDDSFVEEASAVVHEKWVERNKDWAPEELKVAYNQLEETEKIKIAARF